MEKKTKIYKPKPLEKWCFRLCNAWDKKGYADAYLMSETGNTGDNMFHAFVPIFKKGASGPKSKDELQKEFSEIYEGLLDDVKRHPKDYIID